MRRAVAGWQPYAGFIYFHFLLARIREARVAGAKDSGKRSHPAQRSIGMGRRNQGTRALSAVRMHDENMTLPFANIGANRPAEADTLEGDLPDALKRPKGRMVADRGMA